MTLASSYRQTARCLGRCTDLYQTESAIDQRLLAARKKNPGKAFKAKKGGLMTDFGEKTQNYNGHYPVYLVIRDLCLIETAIGAH